ncbi:HPr(Ser) kinase/phosphatase [Monoglobus pectinilyticus]|uniref:HPr(Ser) kinase/phosphatase n=1 Tax=Monoglobus pectinilyticus TaxID=1981510 RepID=UPI00399C0FF4
MEKEVFTVNLEKVIREMKLDRLYYPNKEVLIDTADLNRPGLQITGFFNYFDPSRIQVFGMVENTYLAGLSSEVRYNSLKRLFEKQISAVILTRNSNASAEMLKLAEEFETPVLRTSQPTSSFTSSLNAYLNVELAPRITRHGVLVEVYGQGVLILGESGVGKSETAVELIKRGHRLVADDAVEIKKVSSKSLIGVSPDIIRHFIEIRGIGIVDVKNIFGMGAVKESEKIDMIIHLEAWEKGKQYDRLGLVDEYTNILGLDIPSLTIPVKPGRNLAVIFEVAAMNNRQKRMGYNAAEELNRRITDQISQF